LRNPDDGSELLFQGEVGWDLEGCEIRYTKYYDEFGIRVKSIWSELRDGKSQFVVVSDVEAISSLLEAFGDMTRLIYVHSTTGPDEYQEWANTQGYREDYVSSRVEFYWEPFSLYLQNIHAFDHVFIFAGDLDGLQNQVYKLLMSYEEGRFPLVRFRGDVRLTTESAGGAVVSETGKIALVQEDTGAWSLPKGHVKTLAGEDSVAAAQREIQEELGLAVGSPTVCLGDYARPSDERKGEMKHITIYLFPVQGEPELSPEDPHNPRAIWCDLSHAVQRLSYREDRAFLADCVPRISSAVEAGQSRQ
jgi:ADP-ribose pyrophosphatase YjhB (NUDIX family)